MRTKTGSLEEVSHLALSIGRLLFQNNADTEVVETSVQRFAGIQGCEAHILVTYESLLLTISREGEFRTKTGTRVPTMNVNMAAVESVEKLLADLEKSSIPLEQIRVRLEEIEHRPAIYQKWMLVLGLGLTAASLSRLFGGDWPTFLVTWMAGSAGTWLRIEMGGRGYNVFLIAFVVALVSGGLAACAVILKLSTMPALCLVAPGMIIVPGVPLVNSVQDMIKNHMAIGISRLGFGTLITLAIALGLVAATALTGVVIPVVEHSPLTGLAEDALFSALAALGYLFLFNVPTRLAWVGVLCGVASHTTRTFCLHQGMDIVTGSLVGALCAGFLAHYFARTYRAPVSAFAFPGVVAMIPGAFAFRAIIGYLEIIKLGGEAAPVLLAEVLSLSATCVLMVFVIAIGVASPLLIWKSQRPPLL